MLSPKIISLCRIIYPKISCPPVYHYLKLMTDPLTDQPPVCPSQRFFSSRGVKFLSQFFVRTLVITFSIVTFFNYYTLFEALPNLCPWYFFCPYILWTNPCPCVGNVLGTCMCPWTYFCPWIIRSTLCPYTNNVLSSFICPWTFLCPCIYTDIFLSVRLSAADIVLSVQECVRGQLRVR